MNCPECPYTGKCYMKCATPKKEKKVYHIPKFSAKRSRLNDRYLELREKFLTIHTVCPVTKQPATEIHHKMGRVGYADEWARINGIPLLIDVRYFLAVSRKGHIKIENNPEWAKEKGYSLNRIK